MYASWNWNQFKTFNFSVSNCSPRLQSSGDSSTRLQSHLVSAVISGLGSSAPEAFTMPWDPPLDPRRVFFPFPWKGWSGPCWTLGILNLESYELFILTEFIFLQKLVSIKKLQFCNNNMSAQPVHLFYPLLACMERGGDEHMVT